MWQLQLLFQDRFLYPFQNALFRWVGETNWSAVLWYSIHPLYWMRVELLISLHLSTASHYILCKSTLPSVFFFLLQLQLPAPPFWRLRAKREIVSFLFTKVNYEDSTDSVFLETTLISIFQLLSRNRITLMDIDRNFIFKYQFLEVPAVFVPNTSTDIPCTYTPVWTWVFHSVWP